MELKVWVDGVLRVVCGLSEETTCQEVVIALAQAIGQTGRYVLVQKLRDTERQLVADERPLETLSKLGQLSSDVHFILRRTGPSGPSAGGSSGSGSISSNGSSTGPPPPPDRTTSLAQLPFPKHLNFEVPKRREPKKALTFNLGPSTAPHTRPKHFKKLPRDSPELRGSSPSPVPSPSRSPSSSPVPPHGSSSPSLPSKEEVFRQILQQQAELRALGEHLDSIQQEVWTWEQPPPPVLPPHLLEELDQLEEAMRRNRAELAHTIHWEDELKAEEEREDDLQRDAEELRRLLEEHTRRLDDRSSQLGHLEGALESTREETQRSQLRQAQVTQDSLDTVKAELDRRLREEAELTASLEQTDQDLDLAYRILQARTQELDELSKDLRQCNLQQFILQTGAPPPAAHHADGELLHISQLVEDSDADSEDSGQFSSESQPPLTARQILGDPRSARKPLVLTSRELPWQ